MLLLKFMFSLLFFTLFSLPFPFIFLCIIGVLGVVGVVGICELFAIVTPDFDVLVDVETVVDCDFID